MSKIVVDKNELEIIAEKITSLLQTGNKNFTIQSLKPIYESYDLNKKERIVVDYLNKNPGHSKEQIVSGCSGKCSRVTILKAIKGLLERGFLLERKDSTNKRTYHLFVNNQNVAISLEEVLTVFKIFYLEILDSISPYLKELSKNENNKSKRDSLTEAIIGPYKYLCIMYIMSDLLLWNIRPIDDDTLHRKFAIFFRIMKEIQVELNRLFANVDYNLIAIQLLFESSYGFFELNIVHILKTFDEYGLSICAESLVDALWKISYPILPLIYPSRYKKQFKDGTLKDWRNLFLDKSEPEYKPKHEMLHFEE